jgi:DNA polymerase I-like protein with 3'-5' exonuclease and polymerase domains
MWYLEIEKRIREAGYSVQDAHIVGFIHDEVQIQVRGEYADAIGKITGEAIKQVETDVGFKVPLDAEYQVGTSWAETH